MDHRNRILNGHLARFALHARDGGEPLPQARRPGASGVVVARLPAQPGTFQGLGAKNIAATAHPHQVPAIRVLLVAVNVADFNRARSATQGANGIARRRAGVRPVAEGAVSYLPRFLAPVPPALPGRYSPSSSSSSESPEVVRVFVFPVKDVERFANGSGQISARMVSDITRTERWRGECGGLLMTRLEPCNLGGGRNQVKVILTAMLLTVPALQAQENPFSADARQTYALIKNSMLRAADRMPAENYSFRSTPQVRSFAEMIAHVADAQVRMCGVVNGESPRAGAASKTTKSELVAALRASFDYCDPIYASMTDAAGAAKVMWARWDMSKLGLLNWNISHDNEMYGIIGAFLRLKGLVPPSSEGRP